MDLIIVGAGRQAELVYRAFWPTCDYMPSAFAIEARYRQAEKLFDLPILNFEQLNTHEGKIAFHVAITFSELNATRARLYQQMKAWGYKPASYIAPTAVVPGTATLGEHVFMGALNNIDDYVTVGNCVYFHTLNHIGHHSTIRDNVFISSGVTISGGCDIGDNSFIGVGAAVGHNVKIGARCIIGAGALVTRDIPDDSVVKRAGDKPDGRKSSEVTL